MEEDNLIIQPDDARRLEEMNLLEKSGPKKWLLHQSMRFSNFYPANSADSGQDNKSEIPTELQSIETLIYIGYTPEDARLHWRRWQDAIQRFGDDFPYDFIDMAIAPTETCTLDVDTPDWTDGFNELGIAEDVTTGIMNPRYKDIRDTESAQSWLKDTMKNRFLVLEAIQKASKKRNDSHRENPQNSPTSQ